ncbi:MAG: type II secretion system F family protein [Desulfovibrionaceae bacterium]
MATTMRAFRYKILDKDGKTIRGMVELPFDQTPPAIRYLERQGGTVLNIAPVDPVTNFFLNISKSMAKVGRKDIAEVLNNLSMLLSAGVPVLTAMNDVLSDMKNPVLSQTLKFVITDIEGGQTFSEAIQRHDKVFSPLIQSMCRIGEETGQLDRMLKMSSEHLLHLEEIIGGTKRALMYPSFLLVVVVGACAFWFLFVVPSLVSLFKDMGVVLPPLTRALIAISDWFQNYFFLFIGSVVGFFMFLGFIKRKFKRVRMAMDWVFLHIPVMSMIIETSLVARIAEYLGILQSAGIGVIRTLDIISESIGNTVYERRLLAVKDGIKNGQTLSVSLRQANAMHPFAVRMVSVGEQTGKIEEQTSYVAHIYREKLSNLVEMLGKSLEPAMLVFLGGIFALVIGGLLMPIYDLISTLK